MGLNMGQDVLTPGFADPVLASQAVFRTVMEAMARPGGVAAIDAAVAAPAPLGTAAAALALTLLDFETPVWLDSSLAGASEIGGWFKFHTGAPLTTDPGAAAFAFIVEPARMPDFDGFCQGSVEYPDRSTTLVLQVEHLSEGDGFQLSGPGIKGTRALSAAPLPPGFADRMAANRALFPRGLDIILTCGRRLAALPRSVHLTMERA
jgi:alpha-D-ribose 1-methylphosphonate 5-triphosphate synthase subunit PhnH